MILLLGGTSEGRAVARLLTTNGYRFLISYATPWGATRWGEATAGPVTGRSAQESRSGPLDQPGLEELIAHRGGSVVIDATHPFAATISRLAIAAASAMGVRYLRLERPSTPLPDSDLVHAVPDFAEAAGLSFRLGHKVITVIGVRNLQPFIREAKAVGGELLVRLLALPEAISAALALGLSPSQLLILPQPGGVELNRSLLREYRCQVLVCKDSGQAGGTPEKLEATLSLGLPAVVVQRPRVDYPQVMHSPQEVMEVLEKWLPVPG